MQYHTEVVQLWLRLNILADIQVQQHSFSCDIG